MCYGLQRNLQSGQTASFYIQRQKRVSWNKIMVDRVDFLLSGGVDFWKRFRGGLKNRKSLPKKWKILLRRTLPRS